MFAVATKCLVYVKGVRVPRNGMGSPLECTMWCIFRLKQRRQNLVAEMEHLSKQRIEEWVKLMGKMRSLRPCDVNILGQGTTLPWSTWRGRWEGVGCHGITLQLNCISKFCLEFNQGVVGGFLCQHFCIQDQNFIVVRQIDFTVQVSFFLGLFFPRSLVS